MPFEKGNQLAKNAGGGRKGYEIEKRQLEKMRALVDKDIALLEKLYKGKFKKEDIALLQLTQTRISKYLDKLHASKSESEESKRLEIGDNLFKLLYNAPSNRQLIEGKLSEGHTE